MKKCIPLLILGFILLGVITGYSRNININDLNNQSTSLKSTQVKKEFDISVKKSRAFSLNPLIKQQNCVASGDTIQFDLFAGKNYLSIVEKITTDVNGVKVIEAKLCGFKYAFGFISLSGNSVLLKVDIPELKEKYTTRFIPGNNTPFLVQLDEKKLDQLEDNHLSVSTIDSFQQSYLPKSISQSVKDNYTSKSEGLKPAKLETDAIDSAQIDILVVYTPSAKEWADTYEGGINNTISMAMANCNLVSANSKLGIKFNLVHSTEVDYNETSNSTSDLLSLSEGNIPNVFAIRNALSADLVVMFSQMNDAGGNGYLLDNKYGNEEYGYSVVRIQQASGLSTIHEIGHNLGANHAKDQIYYPGPTNWSNWVENTWSAGWRWKGDDNNYYCDVMTYESGSYFADGITHTAVPYFSDPEIVFQEQPTGNAIKANNACTIREVKQVVAAYREAKNQSIPTVYTVNVHDITSEGALSGGVVINEGKSKVTAKGIVWSTQRKPTLSDNFTIDSSGIGSFTSKLTGLVPKLTYYVRAYATNNSGTAYGDQVSFIYTAGEERDFITRWQLPEGQEKLEFFLDRAGEVNYTWETEPQGKSGYGSLSSGDGLVQIPDLPAGQTIRLNIKPKNIRRFYTYKLNCPNPSLYAPDRKNLLDIEQWGTVQWISMKEAFYDCNNLNITATDLPDLNNVTIMSSMFLRDSILNGPKNINEWNVSSVVDMRWMFENANSFNQNIGSWDVSSVKTMRGMFSGAGNFNQDIGHWNVSSVKEMSELFREASSFNQNIGGWNVSHVTSMDGMFYKAFAFNQDIGNWDVSSAINMDIMFLEATSFNQDIGNWNVSSVIKMEGMFAGAKAFNQDIGRWDVSSVFTMDGMFLQAFAFNQDIGKWDVSNVMYMGNMFQGAKVFNQDISGWNVSKVKDMWGMFGRTNTFNQNIGGWDVSSVTNMGWMFIDAVAFNQDLSTWNVANVTDMSLMFLRDYAFNQDIGQWNLASVTNTENMLDNCGMNCKNYAATLKGWSENSNTPDSLILGAAFLNYNSDSEVARNYLTAIKGWTIKGDNELLPLFNYGSISGETTVCENQKSVIYSVPEIGNATSYAWSLPSGATGTSTTNTISVDFNENVVSGDIAVKGVNACNESTESKLHITVNPKVAIAGVISGDTTVCQNQKSVIYSVPEIENATSYSWTLPTGATGTSTSNMIAVDFNEDAVSGDISVKGVNVCSESAVSKLHITVNPKVTTIGVISGDTVVCKNQKSVTYTVPEIEYATSYNWTLPEGTIGTSNTNTISIDFVENAVSGDISVKGINKCGESAVSKLYITINPNVATAGVISGDTVVCKNQKSVSYTIPEIKNATSYSWTLPNGATGRRIANTLYVDFDDNAVSGDISVKGVNACSESAVSKLHITVNPKVATAGLISGDTVVCQNQKSVIYTVPEIENATLYSWTLPNGATGISIANAIYVDFDENAVSGDISVCGLNECSISETSTIYIIVNPAPQTPEISLNGNTLRSNQTECNQWYYQNAPLTDAINQEYLPNANGEYYVVTNKQGCSSQPSNRIYLTLTGNRMVGSDNDVRVYPNPVTNELTIEMNNNNEKVGFVIINAIGQTVYKGDMVNSTIVPTVSLTPGAYVLRFDNNIAIQFNKITNR
jgi:surface protein